MDLASPLLKSARDSTRAEHAPPTAARQANREARMCQADPTHPSIGQGPSHPSLSPRAMPIHRIQEMPSSPLSHQLHRTCRRRLDSPRPPSLSYPPRALSLPPPPAHMPPQTMVAMLITPYGLVTRLITTTVPVTAVKVRQDLVLDVSKSGSAKP